MNRIFNLIMLLLPLLAMQGQIHEIGLFAGGSNFIGDVGSTTYIAPNEPTIGVLYKWNKSARHSYRFSYTQSKISGDDFDAQEGGRTQRGYYFKNNIKELSAGIEFNFFDFNQHELGRKITPYVFTGVSYVRYEGLYVFNGITRIDENRGTVAVPITVGIKSNITPRFVLGIEAGARYTFADDLDGSKPKNENLNNLQFGNVNNNDWYVFTGLTLTYSFGNKPCYCAE